MDVGLIGWRGMVGSVLMDRMRQSGDFKHISPTFFSTSNPGAKGPEIDGTPFVLRDAYDLDALCKLPVLLSCQGGDYSQRVYGELRARGYRGYWIDAASALRMNEDAALILDPVNRDVIDAAVDHDVRTYCGANCTVSLMLMALQGLFRAGHVEWLSSMTYQAASGAGAAQMRELVQQMRALGDAARSVLDDPASDALAIDRAVTEALRDAQFPKQQFGAPLAASLIPWIDRAVDDGQTREEWKAMAEANKILATKAAIAIDGLCVRVGSMRCHAQAVTVKLKQDVPLDEIQETIASANDWVRMVDNDKESTLAQLSPAAVGGTLEVPVGRIRKMKMGPEYLAAFTVGDQLLWGAAEPLRRMLHILREHGVH